MRQERCTLALWKRNAYDGVASDEQKHVHGAGGGKDIFLLFNETQGSCVGSRLWGHAGLASGFRKSTRSTIRWFWPTNFDRLKHAFCCEPVTRPIVKKLVRGRVKKVHSHGSSIWYNTAVHCISPRLLLKNRDALATMYICLAGC